MRGENLTRDEAVALVGEGLVSKVDGENCDFTGRLTDGTPDQGWTEFSASVSVKDFDRWGDATLTAYYYQRDEDVSEVEELDQMDWEVAHYTVR